MKLIKDLGMEYPTEKSTYTKRFGLYECPVCFNPTKVQTRSVLTSNTTKCKSCSSTIKNTKHGMTGSRIYNVWQKIKMRCNNDKDNSYDYYGGRGISICKDWDNDFSLFKEWSFENGYSEELLIDRIDNNGNYKPNNCRWTNHTVQARNTRMLRKDNTSGYRGVSIFGKKWTTQIGINGKNIQLGKFDTKLQAAKAYDTYVIENNLEHTINSVLYSTLKAN